MVNALFQLFEPAHPNTAIQPHNIFFNLRSNFAYSRVLIEQQLIRNVVFAIVSSKVELDQE